MDFHALSVANGFLFPRQQDQIGQNLVAGGAYVPTLFLGMYATLRDASRCAEVRADEVRLDEFHRWGYDYREFKRRVDAFRNFYGLSPSSMTYKQLDKFLWSLGYTLRSSAKRVTTS